MGGLSFFPLYFSFVGGISFSKGWISSSFDLSCDSSCTPSIPLPGINGGDVDAFRLRILAFCLASRLLILWPSQRQAVISWLLRPLLASFVFFVWSRSFRCRRDRGDPALPLGGAQLPTPRLSMFCTHNSLLFTVLHSESMTFSVEFSHTLRSNRISLL